VLASTNFLVPNATFFVELAAFLIVLFVLGKYVIPPVSKVMDERQGTIRQALSDAEEAKRRATEAEAEYKRVISEARGEARSMVEEANKLAETFRAERREQAEAEYERIVTSARAEIDAQARRASEELRQQAADLAIAVAEKVIGEGIDAQSHRALIDRTIAEVQAQAGTAGVGA
jgi:F-type H+-transporting ATPase subunit b